MNADILLELRLCYGKLLDRKCQRKIGRSMLGDILKNKGVRSFNLDLAGLDLLQLLEKKHQTYASISHCTDLVAVGVSNYPLGLDCESVRKQRSWVDLAETFFSAAEYEQLCDAGSESIQSEFLALWTLKEAFIKQIRGSIFGDLNRVQFDTGLPVITPCRSSVKKTPPWFCKMTLSNCHLALCGGAHKPPVVNVTVEGTTNAPPIKFDWIQATYQA